ncbi:MAG: hypothetical protein AAGJ81_15800 [Verrucomicrobiota bacterium]
MNREKHALRMKRRRLSEIRTANGLLGSIFPKSMGVAEQVDEAIRFAWREKDGSVEPSAGVIEKLIQWYQNKDAKVLLKVLDASSFSGGFLWLGAALDRVLEQLKEGQPGVLVVTGLKDSVRPAAKRWSQRAERERREQIEILEERASLWARSKGSPVTLLVS